MDRFVFPKSFYETIRTFKPAGREVLYSAVFDFIFDDKEPDMKSVELQRVWMLMFPILSKAKKISATMSRQSHEMLKRNSQDTKENVKTISRASSFKEKEKDKEYKDIPPKSPRGYSDEFLKFWEIYPRNDAKQDAYKAFNKAIKNTTLDTLIKSVQAFKNTESWQRDEGKYIPYASTWLNKERWKDELDADEPEEKETAPYADECPVCHSHDLLHSLDRFICNTCRLVWDWNHETKTWEVSV